MLSMKLGETRTLPVEGSQARIGLYETRITPATARGSLVADATQTARAQADQSVPKQCQIRDKLRLKSPASEKSRLT